MPVTKDDLMRRFQVSSEIVSHCEQLGIIRFARTGDLTCYTPKSFQRMEIYLKGKTFGLGPAECRALIEQAEKDARAKQLNYARQMAAKAARLRKPN